jgi:hypothetical protein
VLDVDGEGGVEEEHGGKSGHPSPPSPVGGHTGDGDGDDFFLWCSTSTVNEEMTPVTAAWPNFFITVQFLIVCAKM